VESHHFVAGPDPALGKQKSALTRFTGLILCKTQKCFHFHEAPAPQHGRHIIVYVDFCIWVEVKKKSFMHDFLNIHDKFYCLTAVYYF
jgi:hypothetical protein